MTDSGDISHHLGMQANHVVGEKITLCQGTYLKKSTVMGWRLGPGLVGGMRGDREGSLMSCLSRKESDLFTRYG